MTRTTLDRLASTHGKKCGMKISSDEQTQNNLIRQLGLIYKGAFEAVKEYITNAADAGATEIEININRKPAKPYISIVDNGFGMRLPDSEKKHIDSALVTLIDDIARDSILRFPRSIGNSIKYGDNSTQGKKAIGALAWQVFANGIEVVSKQQDAKPVGWTCNYVLDEDRRPNYEALVFADGIPSREVPGQHGTVITLKDIGLERIKELLPNKLQERIGSMFRDLLLSGKKITIQDDKSNKTYLVKPEEYQGAPLINSIIETKYGPIRVDIYINPNKKDSVVRVKQGIQTLVEDISTARTHLGSNVWGSGMLTGQVKADWIEPDTSRLGIQMDDKAEMFYEQLRKLNSELESAVSAFKKALDPILNRAMYGAMTRAIKRVVEENPDIAELFGGYRKSSRGKRHPGQSTDGYALPLPEDKSSGSSGSNGQNTYVPDHCKPIDSSLSGSTRAKKAITLRFDEEEMPLNILSRFEEDNSVIVFNNVAKAYIEASCNQNARIVYLAGLVGKELMSKMYTEPRDLADKVILFQQAFIRYIPVN